MPGVKEMEALLNAAEKAAVTPKQVAKAPSVYITGFCAAGGHENSAVLSPKGALLKSCAGDYKIRSGHSPIEVKCTCVCHEQFREIRAITDAARRKAEDEAFFHDAIARTFGHDVTPTLPPTTPIEATTGQPGASTAPAPAPRRPTELVIVDLSDTFKPTPTGREARGQLEERVRVVVAKYHVQMNDLMTPNLIASYVNKENPPSPGAIHAIFKRWELRAWCVLGTKPFRLIELTDLGKRQLVR